MAGFHHFHGSIVMGTVALLITTLYTFLPCFLFVFASAPLVEKAKSQPTATSSFAAQPIRDVVIDL
jgi:chromate transporter